MGGELNMYWITGILGLILAVAPFIFGYSNDSAALWTSMIVGGATVVVSLIEAGQADREQWEYYVAGFLGLAAVMSPFIFGFGNNTNAMWITVIIGGLITMFAASKFFQTGRT